MSKLKINNFQTLSFYQECIHRYSCFGSGFFKYKIVDKDTNEVVIIIDHNDYNKINEMHYNHVADMITRRMNADRLLYIEMIDEYVEGLFVQLC